jgi:hypothetical protein
MEDKYMENLAKSKKAYDSLLKSGMFWEFYPQLTGNWDEDRDFWFEEYMERMEAATEAAKNR